MGRPSVQRGRPAGVLLAGGAGSRLGGVSKASVELGGRPLASYPAAALAAVCSRLAVVCKPDTELPPLEGFERWDEPAQPRHPLVGIVHALGRAAPDAVLVCAADMPWVRAVDLRLLLAGADSDPEAMAVVAEAGGRLQPVLGLYRPAALAALEAAAPGEPLTRTVEALAPVRALLSEAGTRSVNTREELAAAVHELGLGGERRGGGGFERPAG